MSCRVALSTAPTLRIPLLSTSNVTWAQQCALPNVKCSLRNIPRFEEVLLVLEKFLAVQTRLFALSANENAHLPGWRRQALCSGKLYGIRPAQPPPECPNHNIALTLSLCASTPMFKSKSRYIWQLSGCEKQFSCTNLTPRSVRWLVPDYLWQSRKPPIIRQKSCAKDVAAKGNCFVKHSTNWDRRDEWSVDVTIWLKRQACLGLLHRHSRISREEDWA